jgi:hypothetical protein
LAPNLALFLAEQWRHLKGGWNWERGNSAGGRKEPVEYLEHQLVTKFWSNIFEGVPLGCSAGIRIWPKSSPKREDWLRVGHCGWGQINQFARWPINFW